MKALGLVFSNNAIFKYCILKYYLLTPRSTSVTKWNGLNKCGRGPPWDHYCEVWSKSEEKLFKNCDGRSHGQTDGRTMDGEQWAITKAPLEDSGVLR